MITVVAYAIVVVICLFVSAILVAGLAGLIMCAAGIVLLPLAGIRAIVNYFK